MNDKDKEAFERWWDNLYSNQMEWRDWQGCDIVFNGKEDMRCGWQAAIDYKQKEIDELKKVNNDLVKSNVSMLVMDYICEGLEIGFGNKLEKLQAENEKLRECVEFYADTNIYKRPDKDRNGMGGMSAMTDFELDDGEWKVDENGEKDHYCYGKRARQVLKELDESNT